MPPSLDASFLTALALFAFANSITPGPNNLMRMASGANFGFARTLPHMAGVVIGFGVLLLAIGLGLGVLMKAWPALHTALYWGGSAYLLYLAWKIATATQIGGGASLARPLRFSEVVAFQWVNPKAWTGAIGGVAAFTKPDLYGPSLTAIVVVFLLVNIPVVATWTAGGVALRRLLDNQVMLRAFNLAMAALLALSAPPVTALLQRLAEPLLR